MPMTRPSVPDLLGGEEAVDAAAAAEVDYGLALIEGGEGGRVSAACGGLYGLGGEGVHFFRAVERRLTAGVCPTTVGRLGQFAGRASGQAPVVILDQFFDLLPCFYVDHAIP